MKTATLLETLKLCKPSLLTQDFVPVLTHFCFESGIVYAYNDVSAICVPFDSELHCAVKGDTLLAILETCGDEVEIGQREGEVSIKSGQSQTHLPILKPDEFLFRPPNEEPNVMLTLDSTLAQAIERCLLSVSNDALRPELGGITVEIKDKVVTFYSSDNKTITRYRFAAADTRTKTKKTVIMPKATCEHLLHLHTAHKDAQNQMAFGDTIMAARFAIDDKGEEALLISKLLQTRPAPFESMISEYIVDEGFFEVPQKELRNALMKADVCLQARVQKQIERCCLIETNGKEMRIKAGGADTAGEMEEIILCTNKKGRVIIDPTFALRALPHVNEMALAQRALVMRSDNYIYLIGTYTD